jgi:hypothetical protein
VVRHFGAAAARQDGTELRSTLDELVADTDVEFDDEDLKLAMETPGFKEQVDQAIRDLEARIEST